MEACTVAKLQERVQRARAFLEREDVQKLVTLYMVETFTHDHLHSSIPSTWLAALLSASHDQLMQIAYGKSAPEWPEDLRTMLAQGVDIALPRQQATHIHGEPIVPVEINSVVKMGLRPKKVHEVAHLSALVAKVAESVQAKAVLDFGSGKGYLGQVLSITSGLRVVGIESQEALNATAVSRSAKIAQWAMKRHAAIAAGLVCGSCPTAPAAPARTKSSGNGTHTSRRARRRHRRKERQQMKKQAGGTEEEQQEQEEGDCAVGGDGRRKQRSVEEEAWNELEVKGEIDQQGERDQAHMQVRAQQQQEQQQQQQEGEETSNVAAHAVPAHAVAAHDASDPDVDAAPTTTTATTTTTTTATATSTTATTAAVQGGFRVGRVEAVTTVVKDGEGLDAAASDAVDGSVITGLHTCGDLHTSLLQIFADAGARALVSVGCCYHRRTEPDDEHANQKVFPLSRFLKSQSARLADRSMELACHARELWTKQPPTHFHAHTNRAILEVIFHKQLPQHDPTQVKIGRMKLKKGQRPGDGGDVQHFIGFATEVMRRLKRKYDQRTQGQGQTKQLTQDRQQEQEQQEQQEQQQQQPRWDLLQADEDMLRHVYNACSPLHNAVVGVYALRVLVATVVETLLLCDRALYLCERGMACDIVALFDPAVSSRNFAIVATKPQQAATAPSSLSLEDDDDVKRAKTQRSQGEPRTTSS